MIPKSDSVWLIRLHLIYPTMQYTIWCCWQSGKCLFGRRPLGGRDTALTFSWHLVSDKTTSIPASLWVLPERRRSSVWPLHPDIWLTHPKPFCSCMILSALSSKCICLTLSNADGRKWQSGKGTGEYAKVLLKACLQRLTARGLMSLWWYRANFHQRRWSIGLRARASEPVKPS